MTADEKTITSRSKKPQSPVDDRQKTLTRGEEPLPCCQLGLGRQRQQCGWDAAN
jgi:hypothetical protein